MLSDMGPVIAREYLTALKGMLVCKAS